MNPHQPKRILCLGGALSGAMIFSGAVVGLVEFLTLGFIRVPWPDEPVSSLAGIKAVLFVVGFLVGGAGLALSSVRELRKNTRP